MRWVALGSDSLRFHDCVIAAEGVATDDEGEDFEGEVNFDMVADGHVHRGRAAKVRQAAGSQFADPLEILSADRYAGPLNHGRFHARVERYVREQVTSQGRPAERRRLLPGPRRPPCG